jgi:hypothetical protein
MIALDAKLSVVEGVLRQLRKEYDPKCRGMRELIAQPRAAGGFIARLTP